MIGFYGYKVEAFFYNHNFTSVLIDMGFTKKHPKTMKYQDMIKSNVSCLTTAKWDDSRRK